MGIFAIRPEGNNVTNRIVGSDGVRNARNERPPLRYVPHYVMNDCVKFRYHIEIRPLVEISGEIP